MATIRPRNGKWRADVKRHGRRWSRTFVSERGAREWAWKVEDLLDRGLDPDAPDPVLAARMTVRVWYEQWLAARVVEKTTADADRNRLSKHVLPRWGSVELGQVRPLQVQQWVKDLERVLSAASVASCHNLLSNMLAAAVREGLLTANPCQHTRLPKVARGREVYLSREQVDQIAGAALSERDRLLILLLAYTGLRWGEASGLQVGEIDMLRRRLSVARVMTRFGPKAYPKSRAGHRLVPIPRFLVDELGVFLATGSMTRTSLLFTTRDRQPLQDQHWRRRAWHTSVERAGLTHLGARPHDLRHTYASWLVQAGRPLEEVRLLLGHESLSTTMRYSHWKPDHGMGAVEVLERPLGSSEVML